MRQFRKALAAARFWSDDRGATAIEYTLIAGLVSIVIVGAVNAIGQGILVNFYDRIVAALTQ
ncbi:MAG: Flp family type IVb pilin [Methylacidiphilales bacterium]|nr:Flp family type IVb pilin [Candidatus Methylacidiphilales bacterium]